MTILIDYLDKIQEGIGTVAVGGMLCKRGKR